MTDKETQASAGVASELNAELDTGIAMNLMLGDCLERMKEIPDGSVDMILTDPPYGTTACKWDSVIDLPLMWEQLKRIIKPNGAIVLFGSEPFSSHLRVSGGSSYKYDYVWLKNNSGNFQLANKQPLKYHENVLVFYDKPSCYLFSDIIKNQMEIKNISYQKISDLFLSRSGGKTGWLFNKLNGSQLPTKQQWGKICDLFEIDDDYCNLINAVKKPTYNLYLKDTSKIVSNKGKIGKLGHLSVKTEVYEQTQTGYPTSVLAYKRETGLHPTQKPVALMEYLIKTYTNEGETVLDFCMGSGTSGIAAKNLNRNFIGIEKDAGYFEIAKQRLGV